MNYRTIFSVRRRMRRWLAWPATALALVASAAAATPAASPGGAPKTHTLFMGVDLSVARDQQLYHVRDVTGGSFVIEVHGRPEFVPMDRFFDDPVSLQVSQALKLSRTAATVSNLVGERAYTAGNNPRMKISSQQVDTMIELGDKAATATVRAGQLEAAASGSKFPILGTNEGINTARPTGGMTLEHNGSIGTMEAAQMVGAANESARRASATLTQLSDPAQFQKRLETELAQELYDAMEVKFEVASEQPLNNPFVVIITRFRPPGAKPGQTQNWIYAKSLLPIADKPVKVRILQGGFPRGFVVEDFRVHLFNQGLEIATNVAQKRVPLSLDEAMLYLSLDYQRLHKADTLPAKVALTSLPADFQTRLARGLGQELLWVKVGKDGRIASAFHDEQCQQAVADDYLAAVLRDVRYQPALENGRPVESLAPLRLTNLPQTL